MNWRQLSLSVVAAAALALALPVLADVVVLRNGQELRGRVRTQGDQVHIELELGGTVTVAKGDIKSTTVEATAAAGADAATVSPELMKRLEEREKVHALVEALVEEKEAARQEAERQLIGAGRGALPIVRQALGTGSIAQRGALLKVVGAIGDPEAVPEIAAVLRAPKDAALHVAAIAALAEIGGPGTVATLTEFLVNSKDDGVRAACLKELAELRAPFAAPFVVEALKSEPLSKAAAAEIGRWGDPVLLPYVLPLLDGAGAARERAAAWVVDLITPAHAAAFTKLFDAPRDLKTLRAGVLRLRSDFPVVGDIELLAAPQAAIQAIAFDALHKITKDKPSKDPKDWHAERDQHAKPHLLLVPLGAPSPALVRDLAVEVATSLKVPVEIERVKLVPFSPAEGRPQDARRALARLNLLEHADFRTARVIGVTPVDVTVPGYEFALAPARREGAIVLSLARLGKGSENVVYRARRLALHALARSAGLPACSDPVCPSSPIYEARELDTKSPRYCTECQRAFTAFWEVETEAAAFRYRAASQKLAGLARQAKSKELAAAAACDAERALLPAQATVEWREYQKLEPSPALGALVSRRMDLLDRAEKWLTTRGLGPQTPPPKRRPPPGG